MQRARRGRLRGGLWLSLLLLEACQDSASHELPREAPQHEADAHGDSRAALAPASTPTAARDAAVAGRDASPASAAPDAERPTNDAAKPQVEAGPAPEPEPADALDDAGTAEPPAEPASMAPGIASWRCGELQLWTPPPGSQAVQVVRGGAGFVVVSGADRRVGDVALYDVHGLRQDIVGRSEIVPEVAQLDAKAWPVRAAIRGQTLAVTVGRPHLPATEPDFMNREEYALFTRGEAVRVLPSRGAAPLGHSSYTPAIRSDGTIVLLVQPNWLGVRDQPVQPLGGGALVESNALDDPPVPSLTMLPYPTPVGDIAIDTDDRHVILGYKWGGVMWLASVIHTGASVYVVDRDQQQLATWQATSYVSIESIAIDRHGHAAVVGSEYDARQTGDVRSYVQVIDLSRGAPMWFLPRSSGVEESLALRDSARAVAMTESGDIIVAGNAGYDGVNGGRLWLQRFGLDGTPRWIKPVELDDAGIATDLVVQPDGVILLVTSQHAYVYCE